MGGAVPVAAAETHFLHHGLLAGEVFAGMEDDFLEAKAQLVDIGGRPRGGMEIVDEIDQPAVVLVQDRDVESPSVVPLDQRHGRDLPALPSLVRAPTAARQPVSGGVSCPAAPARP